MPSAGSTAWQTASAPLGARSPRLLRCPMTAARRRWRISPDLSSATRWVSWRGLSFGCLPRGRPLAFPILMPSRVRRWDEVGLEFGDHGRHVEQQSADRVGRVVDGPAEAEPDPPRGQFQQFRSDRRQPAGYRLAGHDERGLASLRARPPRRASCPRAGQCPLSLATFGRKQSARSGRTSTAGDMPRTRRSRLLTLCS